MTSSAPIRKTKTVPEIASAADKSGLVARFRMRITAGDAIAIGPGKISLLEAISATGSISAAAKSLGMSYRRAWMLLDEMNRAMREPVIDSARGGALHGGSQITDVGRQLIELYRRIEEKAAASCADEIKRLLALVAE